MKSKLPAWIAIVTVSIATFTFVASAAAQSADHLKCFKAMDRQEKGTYVADLGGLITENGCKIKVPAAMVCVPATKTNVQPAPPGGGATGTPNAFGCYHIKCPKLPKGTVLPPVELDDQFGSRVVTAKQSGLLCAPAAVGSTTPPCIEPFDATLQIALDLFVRGLDASGNLDAVPSCGGDPALCCPGGTPTTPCGPLHVELVSAAIDAPPGADRLDVTYRMRLATVTDIPVTVLGSDCGVQIDSTSGTFSTIQLDVPISLNPDHLHIVGVGSVTITDLESTDVQLTGGISCQLANFGASFFLDTLRSSLEPIFQFGPDLCRLCDSTIAPCGP